MLRRQFPLVACSLTIFTATIVTQHAPCLAATVFQDSFDDPGDAIAPRYTPIGDAVLSRSGGRMKLTTMSEGDGIRIDLSDIEGAVCHKIDFSLDVSTQGDGFLWKWIVEDDENNVFPILELEFSEGSPRAGGQTFTTTKKDKDGNVVDVSVQTNVLFLNEDMIEVKWDRRTVDGVEQVQLEFINKTTGQIIQLFPWKDPPPTQTVAFEMTTNYDFTAFDSIVIESEHLVPTVSEWGLIVMTVLVLTAGTVLVGRRRRRAAA